MTLMVMDAELGYHFFYCVILYIKLLLCVLVLPMMAKLIPLDGGKPIIIDRDLTLVGRKQGFCDLVLQKHSVSKLHCLIVRTDGLLFVRDLASTNGTRVNGQKITRGALLPGDELYFSGVGFEVYLGPDEPQDEPKAEKEADFSSAVALSDELVATDGSDSDVRLIEE